MPPAQPKPSYQNPPKLLDQVRDVLRTKHYSMRKEEIKTILSHLSGKDWIMTALMYGCGLRVDECVTLRVKDIDFERNQIVIRRGKGEKDRPLPLPQPVIQPLHKHLAKVKKLHDTDLKKGGGAVDLPFALDRKYTGLSREFNWQYAFPSQYISRNKISGNFQRHHTSERTARRAFAKAVKMKNMAIVFLFFISTVVAQDSNNMPKLGAIQIREIDRMKIVYVPAGSFEMGSSDKELDDAMEECRKFYPSEKNCQRHLYKEQPKHKVTLDAFWIDKTEVTNAQFCKFLNTNGNQIEEGVYWFEPGAGSRGVVYGYVEKVNEKFIPKAGYENYPVIEVSWYGAAAYCKWIGGRLPTEAEWEYAARGPNGFLYPWGNDFNGRFVNYRDSSFTFDNFGKDTSFIKLSLQN